jgi:secreted trypsin-like serine protease
MRRRQLARLGAIAAAGIGAAALAVTPAAAFAEAPEPDSDVEAKIVGGQPADEGQFPWMAAITTREDPDVGYCGGSLIADDLVLTAGHCFGDNGIADLVVRHGDVTLAEADTYAIEDVIVAEGFDHDLEHDWAVVELAEPVPDAEPIPLATADDDDWTSFEVAGWGVTGHTAPSPVLRWAEVPYITDAECGEIAEAEEWEYFPQTQMCAGVLEAGAEVNACPVDSGGPLMAEVDGETVVAGIVSWGSDCYAAPEAGVYASVGAQIDDIAIAVEQLTADC